MPKEPMIVIKKSDGTVTRMTLSEFRAQKGLKGSTVPDMKKIDTPSPVRPVATPTSTQPQKSKVPDMGAPLRDIKPPQSVSQSKPATWDDDDHTSLLEESLPHDAALPMVIDKTSVAKPIVSVSAPAPARSTSTTRQSDMVQAQKKDVEKPKPAIPLPQEPYVWRPSSMTNKNPGGKPVLHDVRPAAPVQPSVTSSRPKLLGPAEELSVITLEDFRRFGATVDARTSALIKKFTELQKESFLLYLKGVSAWRESPLYQKYIGVIQSALAAHETIDAACAHMVGKDDLTKEEIMAIIRINAAVSV